MPAKLKQIEQEIEIEGRISEALNELYNSGRMEYLHFSPAYDASAARFVALTHIRDTRTAVTPEQIEKKHVDTEYPRVICCKGGWFAVQKEGDIGSGPWTRKIAAAAALKKDWDRANILEGRPVHE